MNDLYQKMIFVIKLTIMLGFSGVSSCVTEEIDAGALDTVKLGIISAPSSVSDGEVVTITGYFGNKPKGEPEIWDDFEGGAEDDVIGNGWTQYRLNSAFPRYTSTEKYSGNYSVQNIIELGDTEFSTAWKEFPLSDEVYSSYLFKYTISGNASGIMKLARITSDYPTDSPHYNGVGVSSLQYQPKADWLYETHSNGGGAAAQTTLEFPFVQDEWHRIEIYRKLSLPGKSEGFYSVAIDGNLYFESDIVTVADGITFKLNSFLLPLMTANPELGVVTFMYVDDVYVDSTVARVEIANCLEFELCSKRVVQLPQAWATDSITFKVSMEAFEVGDSLYIYVIDSDGRISDGYFVNQL